MSTMESLEKPLQARSAKALPTEQPLEEKSANKPVDQPVPLAVKSKRPQIIALSVLAIGGLVLGGYYVSRAGLETTDDAQVEADIVSVPARVGGVVAKVNFVENETVKAGDVLLELDDAQLKARVAQAEADLASARAQADAADSDVMVTATSVKGQKSVAEASLQGANVGITSNADEVAQAEAQLGAASAARNQAQTELDRTKRLFESGAISKAALDGAQTNFDAADANLANAKARLSFAKANTSQARAKILEAQARLGQTSSVDAQIASARARALVAHARVDISQAQRDLAVLDLSYTKVIAPRDGIASKKSVTAGQMLSPGQSIVMIVPQSGAWVVANYKETQLAGMHVGQPVEMDVDAYPGLKLHGEIQSMAQATGARFSLLPPDNATGNFTKVVQRVPVRVKLLDAPADKPLRPGMSITATVNVKN